MGLTNREHRALQYNLGKQVRYTDAYGDEHTGFIHGANKDMGAFNYEISKSKKPRSSYQLGKGSWCLVAPINIIY